MDITTPSVLPHRPDAIVIGAGIAGLAGALRLNAGGMAVTLLERHSHTGGKIRTMQSDAGPVDAGPTVLTLRHVFDDLFACAGARLEDHVTLIKQEILARHFWSDGSRLDLHSDPDASIAAIADLAGGRAADEFRRFNTRTQQLFQAFDAPMMQAATPKMTQLVTRVLRQPTLIPAMAPLSTLAQMLERQFSDPRLAQLFGRYATYVGGAPHLSPAILSLIWQAEAAGVWVVKGGMHHLTDALTRLAIARGVTLRGDSHVDRITLRDGIATGVELNGSEHLEASTILYAGDPRALATGSMGNDLKNVAPQTARLPRSFSARVHSFAATPKGPELAHHNVFFADDPQSEFRDLCEDRIPRDPTLYLCAEDRGQGSKPSALERFEMISNAPATPTSTPPMDLDKWHHQTLHRLADFGVSMSPTPTTTTITTPQHFAAMFPQTQGALYGQSPHGLTASLQRPTAQTPIKGLWLAGGGTHPGAGVPMATLSARHAAEAILRARTSTSTSGQTATPGGMSTA
ncbi:Hydroxyneurosporene desaturase [Roseobacter fucihabitans]|uniref:Hydroxyneurosporene desaturase n=1 Tax=Roseobacter fucihabitans TaxID=1537242 RepID=A0ABZ2C0Z0_9RHOB|nr:1-hydroxycarotenoid 3,4-desaturase CrtD [Roseobacter litoralis]MBC6965122.1 Hydroxyneurosporene desaturase [Roseobacter litoralis]MBC6965875.1 Hydroxyneurosporene desaturase [Roseobacter litoralis]